MADEISGLKIRERRRELGMSQADLARRCAISASYLNLIEHDRRRVTGARAASIARALDLDPGALDARREARMLDDLLEVAADPLLGADGLTRAGARELIARFPAWARALAEAHRRLGDALATVEALNDRLAHDPSLGEALHAMLTDVAALRSTSEILATVADIPPPQRERFEANMAEQVLRLSDTSGALVAYFDRTAARLPSERPEAQLDAFLAARRDGFPALEAAADAARARLGLAPGDGIEAGLRAALAPGLRPPPHAPQSARRAALALTFARQTLAAPVEAETDGAPELGGEDARAAARALLTRHAADALRLPRARLAALASALGHDVAAIVAATGEDSGFVLRRLAAAALPGGPRLAFLAVDGAGRLLERRDPHLIVPSGREFSCPLWALHRAPDDGGLLVQTIAPPQGAPLVLLAVGRAHAGLRRTDMLAMPAGDAAGTAYAAAAAAPPLAVGVNCRICAHEGCAHRREPPIAAPAPRPLRNGAN
jgi:transcriptional regulator with XRE-family HTH domain